MSRGIRVLRTDMIVSSYCYANLPKMPCFTKSFGVNSTSSNPLSTVAKNWSNKRCSRHLAWGNLKSRRKKCARYVYLRTLLSSLTHFVTLASSLKITTIKTASAIIRGEWLWSLTNIKRAKPRPAPLKTVKNKSPYWFLLISFGTSWESLIVVIYQELYKKYIGYWKKITGLTPIPQLTASTGRWFYMYSNN